MKSYLMMRDFQLKGVYATTSYLEVRVAIMGRDKVVPLHMWGAGRRGPRLDGRMAYHEGAIFYSEGFPVWEWLLIEILANLAEQWRLAPWCRRCSDTCEIPTVDPGSWQEARYWYATCTRRFGDCEDV